MTADLYTTLATISTRANSVIYCIILFRNTFPREYLQYNIIVLLRDSYAIVCMYVVYIACEEPYKAYCDKYLGFR